MVDIRSSGESATRAVRLSETVDIQLSHQAVSVVGSPDTRGLPGGPCRSPTTFDRSTRRSACLQSGL